MDKTANLLKLLKKQINKYIPRKNSTVPGLRVNLFFSFHVFFVFN